jgi:hypothetical protein
MLLSLLGLALSETFNQQGNMQIGPPSAHENQPGTDPTVLRERRPALVQRKFKCWFPVSLVVLSL